MGLKKVILPVLGIDMESAVVERWLKAEGDRVAKGEPIVLVETDKASTEIVAPVEGVLKRIVQPEGSTVPVTETMALLEVEGAGDEAGDGETGGVGDGEREGRGDTATQRRGDARIRWEGEAPAEPPRGARARHPNDTAIPLPLSLWERVRVRVVPCFNNPRPPSPPSAPRPLPERPPESWA